MTDACAVQNVENLSFRVRLDGVYDLTGEVIQKPMRGSANHMRAQDVYGYIRLFLCN